MKLEMKHLRLAGCLLILGWGLMFLPGCSAHLPTNDSGTLPAADPPGEAKSPMMMRSGRPVVISVSPADDDKQKPLTPPGISAVWTVPRKPPPYQALRAGNRHYFGFEITSDFEKATQAFLAGDGEAALRYYKRAEQDPNSGAAGAWRSSYEYALTLVQTGRPDLAEAELVNTEKRELEFSNGRIGALSLRAEVRYWMGDLEGALADASAVIRELGYQRITTTFDAVPDAVELFRLANNTAAQLRAFITLGGCLIAKGQYGNALPWLELAAKRSEEISQLITDPLYGSFVSPYPEIYYGTGMCLAALATALTALNPASERGEELFRWADEYFLAIGYGAGKVIIASFKAQALLDAGRPGPAEKAAGEGLAGAERLELLDYIWRLETLRGEAFFRLGQMEKAESSLRRAQTVVDRISETMTSDEAKIRFGSGKEKVTRYLVEIDVGKKDFDALFQDMERGRARAFVSLLAQRKISRAGEEPLMEEIRILDKAILKERQRKSAFASPGKSREQLESNLLNQRAELITRLRERAPDLADALAVSTIDLPSAQRRLKAGEILVYTLPPNDEKPLSYLLITGEKATLKTLSITPRDLRKKLQAFHRIRKGQGERGIKITPPKAGENLKKNVETLAMEELRRNLAPADWGAVKAAYVVPGGDLYFVPWGALNLDFPVTILPTGSWKGHSGPAGKPMKRAGIVGNPNFGGQLPQLTGAQREAIAIAKHYEGQPLTGSEATENRLRQLVGQGVDVLHLATHALYDPLAPLQSAVILTTGNKPLPLTAEKLYDKPLPARLVVLSACETGMGQVIAGDDLLGLVRSFYLGGATTVVSSLWPVEDEATRLFMEIFHEKSREGDFGAAWLAARDTLKNLGYHPADYGAFTLGGSFGN